MEKVHDAVIREFCGLPQVVPPIVKEWDNRIIVDERRQMLLPSGHKWQVDHLAPLGVMLHGNLPGEAAIRFIQAYQIIGLEFHKKPVLMAYDPGEYQTGHADTKVTMPEVRMIDLRGGCAFTVTPENTVRFLHGNWDLVT
jgi:hypothetical protein